jgi:hypothetical protein
MTEARVTLVDAYLAASVVLGLVLNAVFCWWWADPIAALVIVSTTSRKASTPGEAPQHSGSNSFHVVERHLPTAAVVKAL